jgi:outer membrane protein OmpA-like peptidoglycan-associated protein
VSADRSLRLRRIAKVLALATVALLAWAFLWPDARCSSPECAKLRFRVAVELDMLRGVEPVPLDVARGGDRVSLQGLLAAGGIELDVLLDHAELPYDPSAGALTQTDLFAYAEFASSRAAPRGADARIYALVVPALVSDEGVPLFGVLFDRAGREGIAVAPATTRRLFRGHDDALIPLLQLRTFTHELLHALNRHHVDAAPARDGRLTVEAPTRCIAEVSTGIWQLQERPLWALSPATIRHFQTARPADVLPGAASSPFDLARGSARDCEVARLAPAEAGRTRFARARERLIGLFTAMAAADGPYAGSTPRAALRLEVQAAPYPVGFPIVVRLHASNTGEAPLAMIGRLAPPYGVVNIETRREGDEAWRTLQPLYTLDPIDDPDVMLAPGETTTESIEIYFGEGGWTFPGPGRYEIRARTRFDELDDEIVSEPVTVSFETPATPADEAAAKLLLDEDGRLDVALGRFLVFRGRIRATGVVERIERLLREHPQTAIASALRFTAAAGTLRPPIDPATGRRGSPDTTAARRLLAEACRDSGIAALGERLLRAAADATDASAAADAWEGTRPNSASPRMLAYGDEALVPAAQPVQFGQGEVSLRTPMVEQVSQVASALVRDGVRPILVAGHTDGTGTCADNDTVGLKRAEAVARALVRRGVREDAIEIVSLGPRRPVDFASGEAAAALNRRVEIWVKAIDPTVRIDETIKGTGENPSHGNET